MDSMLLKHFVILAFFIFYLPIMLLCYGYYPRIIFSMKMKIIYNFQ